MSVYFSQLISDGDKILKMVCDIYNRFVNDRCKIFWVKEVKKRFNRCLNSKVFGPKLNIEINAKELIDLFWYGALFFHSSQKIEEEKKKILGNLINQN